MCPYFEGVKIFGTADSVILHEARVASESLGGYPCKNIKGDTNFASPSRAENRQAKVKLTESPIKTFNSKWENQILVSETFYECWKINFKIGVSRISS